VVVGDAGSVTRDAGSVTTDVHSQPIRRITFQMCAARLKAYAVE